MNRLVLAILLFTNLFAGSASAEGTCATEQCNKARKIQNLPADVKSFVERRDGCDHFRGEPWDSGDEPGMNERREFIFQNLKKLCAGTDNQLKKLRVTYSENTAILNLLAEYEDNIEMN